MDNIILIGLNHKTAPVDIRVFIFMSLAGLIDIFMLLFAA